MRTCRFSPGVLLQGLPHAAPSTHTLPHARPQTCPQSWRSQPAEPRRQRQAGWGTDSPNTFVWRAVLATGTRCLKQSCASVCPETGDDELCAPASLSRALGWGLTCGMVHVDCSLIHMCVHGSPSTFPSSISYLRGAGPRGSGQLCLPPGRMRVELWP